MKQQNNTSTLKTAFFAHLKEATTTTDYDIFETMEYELPDDFDQADAEQSLENCECPDLDVWAPYYNQRSEMVKTLSNSEMGECEDYLEGLYGKSIFDGCESFTDCEARIAWASLEIKFNEAKNDIREAIESFFEDRSEVQA
jgi:hypothetical protein